MSLGPGLPLQNDPLAINPAWPCPLPLTPLEQALELTMFRSGVSREEWLKRLANDLHKQALVPLLWLLPRGWRLAPAQLPVQLQTLAGVLERGLLTPALLAALADDLPHLLPAPAAPKSTPLQLWQREENLPHSLAELLVDHDDKPDAPAAAPPPPRLSGGLIWANRGLAYDQDPSARRRNSRCAALLNRLGANLLGGSQWRIDGCSSAADWLHQLHDLGWSSRAQLRSSVASFGLGACLPLQEEPPGWSQVPLGLPIRTGLLDPGGEEIQALLPHSCLELELSRPPHQIRLQYYQGTEGLCGWEGLNDLHRPWQNDRHNGTVRYLGEPMAGDQLLDALHLCDAMALVHNLEGTERQLLHGGYGTLGFCIDSSALLQQALEDRCQLFPVMLGGIWRERLSRRCRSVLEHQTLGGAHRQALERYQRALEALPFDVALHGPAARDARTRLLACQPNSSPFRLVEQLTRPLPQP
jgi:hypothetical protein